MQILELIVVYALIAVTAYLLRGRLAWLNHAPVALRLCVGFVVGAVLVFPLLAKGGVDVVPDTLEPFILAALIAILVFLVWVSVAVRR